MNNNNHGWTQMDIEPMLMNKRLPDLSKEEVDFLLDQLGSWEQIKAYQQFIAMSHTYMDAQDHPEIEPDPAIQKRISQKLKPQKTYKNGFESILVAFLGLFKLTSPIQSGMIAAMLAICFWINGTVNDFTSPSTVFANDSLAMQTAGIDSSIFFNRFNTNSITDSAYQWQEGNNRDSFSIDIKGIIRQ